MTAKQKKQNPDGCLVNYLPSVAHFDNYFAEGSTGQVLVGFTRLLEGIDLIDYWMNLVSVEEIVHAFEGAGRRDGYSANCSLPEDNVHEI